MFVIQVLNHLLINVCGLLRVWCAFLLLTSLRTQLQGDRNLGRDIASDGLAIEDDMELQISLSKERTSAGTAVDSVADLVADSSPVGKPCSKCRKSREFHPCLVAQILRKIHAEYHFQQARLPSGCCIAPLATRLVDPTLLTALGGCFLAPACIGHSQIIFRQCQKEDWTFHHVRLPPFKCPVTLISLTMQRTCGMLAIDTVDMPTFVNTDY